VSLASTIGNPEINQDVNSFLLLRLKPQDDLSGGYISYFLKRVSFLYRDFELKKIRLEERNRKEEINKMSGVDFESFVRDYLTDKGAVCEMTPASGDYGADIIAKVEGRRIAIQCKRYSANVGYSAVQEVVAGKAYYKCDEAWVVTNASFTQQAIQGAKKMDVKLHNIFELMNKCKN
jgi:HJR/Mrr/RecB family endonuclease